ncbi:MULTISPECIES: phage tail spike protein [unclassified Sporosarcina]|uniref:phage tail spike protein n=1 Tax=unclassified Sporosarcina TaxID=2647733 RepID=UPI00203E49FC|nr:MULTISPECIES: phage tail spike protein [unclassified Sporosarcina]GKV64671.1 hypothetical protein NCCP2331_08240 [Sporosarcina sp. NCCP-2331]GLB54456.1 hypothetical protein NCCP2378_02410 [Sporosarcina sp. NCCP-2378]
MLYVTDLNGNTEPLNHIQRVEINEEVNGAFTLALTSFFHDNNPGHALIEEESIISVEDHDYRIKQLKENKGRKEAVAIHTFFDVAGTWKHEIFGGTRSFNDFANFVFSGTGWTVDIQGVSGMAFIANFGNDNVIKLVNILCGVYECEYRILPGKKIQFAKQVGPDNDVQYRYGHNVKALSKSVDTTNLRTRIKGYGGDGVEVTYTSDAARKYGIIDAEPIYDEEYATADLMSERLVRELTDYPEVIFDLDVAELLDKEIGERIWLIYEPMNIEFQTRILAKKSVWRKDKFVTESITIGNAKRKTLSDILASTNIQIDENARQTRSRIEQTNDRITLAVEEFAGEILKAYAKIELTAREIRMEVADLESDLRSSISITASQIRSEVADVKSGLQSSITQTAGQIRSEVSSEVTRVDGRIDTANSSITQLSDRINLKAESSTVDSLGSRVNSVEFNLDAANAQISQKVSQSDYNGNTITSLINQTSTTIDIQASKINLVGAVNVLSDISGNLGTITSGNINISQDLFVGNNIRLGRYLTGTKRMTLADGVAISSDGWSMSLTAVSGVGIENAVFTGTSVSFASINSINWGSNRPTAVWG